MSKRKILRGPYLTLEEKKWICQYHEENKKLTLADICMAFYAKFNRNLNRSSVSRILAKKRNYRCYRRRHRIDNKAGQKIPSLSRAAFESDLE